MSRKKNEVSKVDETAKDAIAGSDSVVDSSKSNTPDFTLSDADKAFILNGITEKLLPQLQTYIDKKFKELHPTVEKPIETSIMSSGVPGAASSGAPDLSKIIGQVGQMLQGNGQQNTPQQAQGNPLEAIAALAGNQGSPNGAGGIGTLMQILQLFGVMPGQQQGGGMSNIFQELMIRKMIADTEKSAVMDKIMVSGMVKMFGADPALGQDFASINNALVHEPLKKAAGMISGGNGQQ